MGSSLGRLVHVRANDGRAGERGGARRGGSKKCADKKGASLARWLAGWLANWSRAARAYLRPSICRRRCSWGARESTNRICIVRPAERRGQINKRLGPGARQESFVLLGARSHVSNPFRAAAQRTPPPPPPPLSGQDGRPGDKTAPRLGARDKSCAQFNECHSLALFLFPRSSLRFRSPTCTRPAARAAQQEPADQWSALLGRIIDSVCFARSASQRFQQSMLVRQIALLGSRLVAASEARGGQKSMQMACQA